MVQAGINQEKVFNEVEADAWFRRNASYGVQAASPDHHVLSALRAVELPQQGFMLDIGGAAGAVAAGFKREYPGWKCQVVEPSAEAIAAGREAFPKLHFSQGSICQNDNFSPEDADVVIVSGVFCWVDRLLLSRAICNIDLALAAGGLLVISDFDSPFPRANPYKHHEGLYTYKQNYTDIFTKLGTYHLLWHESKTLSGHTAYDSKDFYDRQWGTTVLRKDPVGRYFRAS
ncbi:MAG: class I SAM-dependent methyltransferase [Leptolyngbyaceae cyanobacterium]